MPMGKEKRTPRGQGTKQMRLDTEIVEIVNPSWRGDLNDTIRDVRQYPTQPP
jgi:hypothetical protein